MFVISFKNIWLYLKVLSLPSTTASASTAERLYLIPLEVVLMLSYVSLSQESELFSTNLEISRFFKRAIHFAWAKMCFIILNIDYHS